ncbi:hypothetical protein ACFL2I_00135 [Candidatus Omnitrophota bacterium]
MNRIHVISILVLLTLISFPAWAQDVTLSTYYPAPFGAYNQLSTRTLGVGDNDGNGLIDNADAPVAAAGNADSLYVAGRVGIGTMTPQEGLHILDSGADSAVILETGASEYELRAGNAANNFGIYDRNAGNAARLVIDGAGGVGINTGSPGADLDVRGEALISPNPRSPLGQLHVHTGVGAQPALAVSKDAGGVDDPIVIFYRDMSPIDEVVRIERTGRVGIGTNNPAGELDVFGTICLSGGQIHPDYVFEPEYQLETIEEHAAYMWREKHLKAIPKVKMKESGQEFVEIGAQNMGILEELEKAHIYIDQLNQKLKLLEEKIAALR